MLLLATDARFAEHDTGPGHPERAARLQAVEAGLLLADLGTDLVALARREATREELERVHPAEHLDALEAVCARRGHFDADTPASAGSWTAALTAAGAGLAAVDALAAGDARGAFLAIRPPGHHARPSQAMGFCLLNNVAVVAAALRGARRARRDRRHRRAPRQRDPGDLLRGPRRPVRVVPRVAAVPGHGPPRRDRRPGAGTGTTCNVPLPAGATGDVYLRGMDEVVAPLLTEFAPTWLLISAGFDAHRDDPITGLGLSAADYAALTERLVALAPAGRVVTFLEGGYSLTGLRDSVAASIPVLAGGTGPVPEGEGATNGGPGDRVVTAVGELWRQRRTG